MKSKYNFNLESIVQDTRDEIKSLSNELYTRDTIHGTLHTHLKTSNILYLGTYDLHVSLSRVYLFSNI